MTFVSYAQNFEDVVLNRALSDVENGFYIDVGANDPLEDSVTKAFYDRGWTGINIEPLKEHIDALTKERPRDINLQIAIGNQEGEIEIWNPGVRGWSTGSADVAQMLRASGREIESIFVPVRPLNAVWEECVSRDVHFLKIDVEGFEKSVLESLDFRRFRPWIVVVEAINSTSNVPDHDQWEGILTSADYRFAYFDGLNRFYVAEEHGALSARLAVPPNVLDDFVKFDLVKVHETLQEKDAALAESAEMYRQIWKRLEGLEHHLSDARIGENFIKFDERMNNLAQHLGRLSEERLPERLGRLESSRLSERLEQIENLDVSVRLSQLERVLSRSITVRLSAFKSSVRVKLRRIGLPF